jgi:predicted Fe-Mo cluster-binding NifX family protein
MKIAIPTDDQHTLAPRSGRSKWFMIFDIQDRKIIGTSINENTHDHSHDHSHHHEHGQAHDHAHGEHSHADMIQLLIGCDLMITKKVGPHFGQELKAAQIKIQITSENLILQVLKPYLD